MLCFEEVEACSSTWACEARTLLDTIETTRPPSVAADVPAAASGTADLAGAKVNIGHSDPQLLWQRAFERRHGTEICVATADDGAPQEWLGVPFWEPFRRLTGERILCVKAMVAHLTRALALPVHSNVHYCKLSGARQGSGTWVRSMLNFEPVRLFGDAHLVRTEEFCKRVNVMFDTVPGSSSMGIG